LAGQRDKVIVSCGFPTKNTRFLLDKPQIKIENPGKKNTIKRFLSNCYKRNVCGNYPPTHKRQNDVSHCNLSIDSAPYGDKTLT